MQSLTSLDDLSLQGTQHFKLNLSLAASITTMVQGHKFQDLEETGAALVAYINSSQPEKLMEVKSDNLAIFDQHAETKKFVTQILKGK